MTDSKQQRAQMIQDTIRQALMQHWDPIGVSDVPEARNEYNSYVGPVYRLLASGASDTELVDYLYKTETETMGLTRFFMRGHLKKVVAKLREIDVSL
jgi:hypothetical protein